MFEWNTILISLFRSVLYIAGDCPFTNLCAGIDQWKPYHWMPIVFVLTNLVCIIAGTLAHFLGFEFLVRIEENILLSHEKCRKFEESLNSLYLPNFEFYCILI